MFIFSIFLAFASEIPINYIPETRTPPLQRSSASMTYMSSQSSLFVFSGQDANSNNLNDLWEFSLSNNYWISLVPNAESMPGTP